MSNTSNYGSRSPDIKIVPSTSESLNDDIGVSPMTNLSVNLGSNLRIKRNRSMGDENNKNEEKDANRYTKVTSVYFSPPTVPVSRNRMLKNKVKYSPGTCNKNLSPVNKRLPSTSSPTGSSRRFLISPKKMAFLEKENASLCTIIDSDIDMMPLNSKMDEIHHPSKGFLTSPKARILSRNRLPLEDQDPNSQDSGYSNSSIDDVTGFRFLEPTSIAPRRGIAFDYSPRREGNELLNFTNNGSPISSSSTFVGRKMYHSVSMGSEYSDDGFMDQLPSGDSPSLMNQDESTQLPDGFSTLLSGTILKLDGIDESPMSSDLFTSDTNSMMEPGTPVNKLRSTVSTKLEDFFTGDKDASKRHSGGGGGGQPDDSGPFLKRRKRNKLTTSCSVDESLSECKSNLLPTRPQPQLQPLPQQRGTLFQYGFKKTVLQRSFSENEATIKNALQRASSDPNLIGDFSKQFALPLRVGKHPDLKNISCDTLAKLINGQYDESVESYTIVDCRYPYEYEGGHIRGAINIYTKDQVLQEFLEKPSATTSSAYSQTSSELFRNKRKILIFHCEFSSERGPNLSRFLRNLDRDKNSLSYPKLDYPEMYLLEGGYCEFYQTHKELCDPSSYRTMLDPNHTAELRIFRSRSKSWACANDARTRHILRTNLKRLGL